MKFAEKHWVFLGCAAVGAFLLWDLYSTDKSNSGGNSNTVFGATGWQEALADGVFIVCVGVAAAI